jgi:hypothetical protein
VSSATENKIAIAYVAADDQTLIVSLSDGRRLVFPLDWFPRLRHGSPAERNNWRLIGRGEGVHWPELDEDLSLEGFLAGRRSAESKASVDRWLKQRPGKPAKLSRSARAIA